MKPSERYTAMLSSAHGWLEGDQLGSLAVLSGAATPHELAMATVFLRLLDEQHAETEALRNAVAELQGEPK